MARLLIVSRSMALAMRLGDQHEVLEHPVDQLDDLMAGLDANTDVLVLDIGDPVLAVNTVNSLREAERDTPVLLVSGYQPEWEQVEAQQVEGVAVVPLPITRSALLVGIAQLTGEEIAGGFGPADLIPVDEEYAKDHPGAPDQPEERAEQHVDDGSAFHGGPALDNPPDDYQPYGLDPEREAVAAAEPDPEPNGRPFAQEPQLPMPAAAVVESARTPGRRTPVTQRWGRNQPPPPPAVYPNGGARSGAGQNGAGQSSSGQNEAEQNGAGQSGGGSDGRRFSRLGNRPRKLQRHPNDQATQQVRAPGMGLVTDPLGPRTGPYGLNPGNDPRAFPASTLETRLDAEAAALASARPFNGEAGAALRTADLVDLLHQRAGDLYGVSDTAQVLADDVIERADADAAAILVPDGPSWRVSGGVGLRPLERRLVLEETHWLITEIGAAGRAVLIEDTDIIRQQLAGAPLAAWRHLLAVPVPDVRAIVVLARGSEGGPFTDRDLSAVIAPVREAAALLAQAVQTRRLARLLSPLQELDDPRRPSHD